MKRGGILRKIILVLLCVLLAGGLGYFLLQYRQEERAESLRLRQDAEIVQEQERRITPKPIPKETPEESEADEAEETGKDQEEDEQTSSEENRDAEAAEAEREETTVDAEAGEKEATADVNDKDAAKDEEQAEEESREEKERTTEDSENQKTEDDAAEGGDSDTEQETETADSTEEAKEAEGAEESEGAKITSKLQEITMIGCRGDAWQQGEDTDRTIGWPAKLQAILEDRHIDLTVFDGTWDMSGSLSQLRYGGISEEETDAYIAKHQQNGLSEVRTETIIRRDLERNYVERTDFDAIPVITIGYFGGFGQNLEELIEQQRKLLETYHIPQIDEDDDADNKNDSANDGKQGISGCYLILGRYPNGWTDQAAYDAAMTEAWGDHYVSLNDLGGDVFSDDFRQKVADTVYIQLKDKGYLLDDTQG